MHRCAHPLGLPDQITAAPFDLDGMLTSTAEQHRQAWKETFDAARLSGCGQAARASHLGASGDN